MVSRRNYLSITTLMLVVCFLFMLPLYIKDTTNPYEENSFVSSEPVPGEQAIWKVDDAVSSPEDLPASAEYMLFVGDPKSGAGYAVQSWAQYTKTPLFTSNTLPACSAGSDRKPQMILLEADAASDLSGLQGWNEAGVTIVFCSLPDAAALRRNPDLCDFLGIREIAADAVELDAVHLFSGFLLGGERIYSAENPGETQMMDLNLVQPWFRLALGTEVYMMGLLSEEILPDQPFRNELLPALLWRHARMGTNVFAVAGDFLSGNTGIGLLSAIAAEDRGYFLYPVVNAQVFTVADFPQLSDENEAAISARYGKSLADVTRDLLWPSIESMAEVNAFRPSCFLQTQFDDTDSAEPDEAKLVYYLKLLKEENAEAGQSLQHAASVTLEQKLAADAEILSRSDYSFSAAYADEQVSSEIMSNPEALSQFWSVSGRFGAENELFSFLTPQILGQAVTHDLLNYSFRSDLELRSLQTALGYSNVLLDMHRISWPEADEPGWEVYYENAASKLHTYWNRFSYFDRLSITQSDTRLRSFLCMDYAHHRSENTILLDISGADSADFILRTHMEEVVKVTGGTARELEEDAWLIHAKQSRVEIVLTPNESVRY